MSLGNFGVACQAAGRFDPMRAGQFAARRIKTPMRGTGAWGTRAARFLVRRGEEWSSLITAEGDEMRIAASSDALEMFGHGREERPTLCEHCKG